jgi:hypothetical protein
MEIANIRKPDFFIVGAPKCGTTALDHYLSQHPEIFIPDIKEINYFGTDLLKSPSTVTEKMYLSFFLKAKNEKRLGESTVWYIYSPGATSAIKEFNPSAQIIIMLRNPVDMLYSYYYQLLFNGDEDIMDFKSALDAEQRRKKGLDIPRGPHSSHRYLYREIGTYSNHVKRYLDVFGYDNVLIIIYDDFKEDVAAVYKKTLQFLKVSDDFRPEFKVINPSKTVRSKTFRSFLNAPPNFVLWLGRLLVPSSQRYSLNKFLVYLNAKYEKRPPMDPELRKQLQQEFLPEIKTLSALLGRDLTHWCKN